jgi:hypothetical protein
MKYKRFFTVDITNIVTRDAENDDQYVTYVTEYDKECLKMLPTALWM